MHTGHARGRALARENGLYISPVSLLELSFLEEAKRIRLVPSARHALAQDSRWAVDNPMSTDLFEAAFDLSWTRDPFDRLIVAHAQMRGWRLATSDRMILSNLPGNAVIAL